MIVGFYHNLANGKPIDRAQVTITEEEFLTLYPRPEARVGGMFAVRLEGSWFKGFKFTPAQPTGDRRSGFYTLAFNEDGTAKFALDATAGFGVSKASMDSVRYNKYQLDAQQSGIANQSLYYDPRDIEPFEVIKPRPRKANRPEYQEGREGSTAQVTEPRGFDLLNTAPLHEIDTTPGAYDPPGASDQPDIPTVPGQEIPVPVPRPTEPSPNPTSLMPARSIADHLRALNEYLVANPGTEVWLEGVRLNHTAGNITRIQCQRLGLARFTVVGLDDRLAAE